MVNTIARQVAASVGPCAPLDDLVSFGREGLLIAARRYDPSRGVPFRAYAQYRVRGSMIDGLRALAPLPRRVHDRLKALRSASLYSEGAAEDVLTTRDPTRSRAEAERALSEHLANMATAMAIGLIGKRAYAEGGELTAVDNALDPAEATERMELLRMVVAEIEKLPPQQGELVRRHYLEGDRFDEVASELGLSKSWASRLHTRAIARLTQRFAELGRGEPLDRR